MAGGEGGEHYDEIVYDGASRTARRSFKYSSECDPGGGLELEGLRRGSDEG